ncbi:MAG TPA: phosphatase PAP2 family protein [Candidatus Paceibacterota bacterium]
MHEIDIKIFYAINHLPHNAATDFLFKIFDYTTTLGIGWIVLFIILFATIKKQRKNLLIISGTVLTTWVVELIIKVLVQRPRPSAILNDVIVVSKYFLDYSFPSGQTTVAFAAAITIAMVYGKKWFVYLVFIFAVLVSFSRIFLGAHYLTDVVAGIMVGSVVPVLVFKIFKLKSALR